MNSVTYKERITRKFENAGRVLHSLEIAVKLPIDEHRAVIDATIRRFKFSIELFKKVLRSLLLEQYDIDVASPREIFQEAFQVNLIQDEQLWARMIKDRNMTSHTYHEELADEIYTRIKKEYIPAMLDTYKILQKKFEL